MNKIENIIKAAASSRATTGSNVDTTGPLALYCLITIKVAAGAVAQEIALKTKTNSHVIFEGKIKCKIMIPTKTHSAAPSASAIVITITLLPTYFKESILKEVPIVKAIKPNATSEIQLKLLVTILAIGPVFAFAKSKLLKNNPKT